MRVLGLIVAGSLTASAMAADLNISVQSGGSNEITVAPGAVITYEIVGTLSDTANEGLALWGVDLHFTGGALTQADTPAAAPMNNFANDLGINNPAGYGGTIINDDLIQIGGGQNTINNNVGNAPFPIGTVITGVAHSAQVLVTGSLTVPATPGDYTLEASNLFANVIKDGETGVPFWATEAAGVGTIDHLTIHATDVPDAGDIVASDPVNDAIDARQPSNPDGTSPAAGFSSVVLTFSGDPSALTPADFTMSEDGDDGVPVGISSVTFLGGNDVEVVFTEGIHQLAWTTITHTLSSTSVRLGYLPGDVNNDTTSAASDLLAIIDHLNGVILRPMYAVDVDRTGLAGAPDVVREIDLLNGAGSYDPYLGVGLP